MQGLPRSFNFLLFRFAHWDFINLKKKKKKRCTYIKTTFTPLFSRKLSVHVKLNFTKTTVWISILQFFIYWQPKGWNLELSKVTSLTLFYVRLLNIETSLIQTILLTA